MTLQALALNLLALSFVAAPLAVWAWLSYRSKGAK